MMDSNAKAPWAVGILLLIFAAFVFTSFAQWGPTCDEASHHLSSGYSFLVTRDFRVSPAHPPLAREICAVPLLFLKAKFSTDYPGYASHDSAELGRYFVFQANRDKARAMVFWSRVPSALAGVALGGAVFFWARALFGLPAGILALFLYAFCPNLIANSGLAMTDIWVTFFFFLTMFSLWRFVQTPTRGLVWMTGVWFGCAQAAKHSAIVLFPISLVLVLVEIFGRPRGERSWRLLGKLAAIWAIGIGVLWATYFFEVKPLLQNVPDPAEKIAFIQQAVGRLPGVPHPQAERLAVKLATEVPIPLASYVYSLIGVVRMGMVGQGFYFLGERVREGNPAFFVVDFLIKTPIPVLILLLAAFATAWTRGRIPARDQLFLLLPVGIFLAAASFSQLQGGIRYLLPIYPFLYVWAGRLAALPIFRERAVWKVAAAALAVWIVAGTVRIHPNHLAYSNELIGGPSEGWKYTNDNDWGQDLKGLAQFVKAQNVRELRLLYFGSDDPSLYAIPARDFEPRDFKRPEPGAVYAISVRQLPAVRWAWFLKPVRRIGYTIFVYRT